MFHLLNSTRNVKAVCRKFGIHRSQFYYWKQRLYLAPCANGKGYSRAIRLQAYSRKPQTNPKTYSPEVTKLIIKIRKRTKRGAEHQLISPAYPRANSHVERTHRIDVEEVYRRKTFTSLPDLLKLNLKSLKYFNEKRSQKSEHFFSQKQRLNYTILNA